MNMIKNTVLLALLTSSSLSFAAPLAEVKTTVRVKAPSHFMTLAARKALPNDAQCAAWVAAQPIAEARPGNAAYNASYGKPLALPFFHGDDARANRLIAARVTGHFVGTTEEILRWGACKWGIDENVVKAMALQDSDWQQARRMGVTHLPETAQAAAQYGNPKPAFQSDDCTKNTQPGSVATPSALPNPLPVYPPAGTGSESVSCARDWGVLQVNYEQQPSAWPEAESSTAMNVDVALASVRVCFEGYETWLAAKPVSAGVKKYAKGDLMGCVGRYKSGLWHDTIAESYIANINQQVVDKSWQHPDFAGKAWVYP
ncbi:MAG: hypothetical protein ABL915_10040 [Gallionella sp.]